MSGRRCARRADDQHKQFGRQFSSSDSSRCCRRTSWHQSDTRQLVDQGHGDAFADRIVDKFGEQTLE